MPHIKIISLAILLILTSLVIIFSHRLTPDKKIQGYLVGILSGIMGAIVGSFFTDPR